MLSNYHSIITLPWTLHSINHNRSYNHKPVNTGFDFGADPASYSVPTVSLFHVDKEQGAPMDKVFSVRYELK